MICVWRILLVLFVLLYFLCLGLNFEIGYPQRHFSQNSFGPIEAKNGNPPLMPAVMTPGGPLDLSSVLFRNRIIFIGQPVNLPVAQRVISQLITLATIDEDADILVTFIHIYFCILKVSTYRTTNID